MSLYEYSVWFRDHDCIPSDQDYEWVVCFIVEARSLEEAKSWGDEISRSYVLRNANNEIVSSATKLSDTEQLPVVKIGTTPSDEFIGW